MSLQVTSIQVLATLKSVSTLGINIQAQIQSLSCWSSETERNTASYAEALTLALCAYLHMIESSSSREAFLPASGLRWRFAIHTDLWKLNKRPLDFPVWERVQYRQSTAICWKKPYLEGIRPKNGQKGDYKICSRSKVRICPKDLPNKEALGHNSQILDQMIRELFNDDKK